MSLNASNKMDKMKRISHISIKLPSKGGSSTPVTAIGGGGGGRPYRVVTIGSKDLTMWKEYKKLLKVPDVNRYITKYQKKRYSKVKFMPDKGMEDNNGKK